MKPKSRPALGERGPLSFVSSVGSASEEFDLWVGAALIRRDEAEL